MRANMYLSAALLLFGNMMTANATIITASTINNGGSMFTTTYTVAAELGEAPIDEFSIFFDSARYASLTVVGAPAGFDAIAVQPDPAIPADGYFDVLALGGGISFGAPVGNFVVSYNFTGAGLPGRQLFNVVDPLSFDTIRAGFTTLEDGPNEVPEPGALSLMLLGAGMLAQRRRTRAPAPTHSC